MANPVKKKEVLILDKGFVAGIIDTLKELDVRGYDSNKKLVIVTMELERAFNTPLPLEIEPNQAPEQGNTERTPEDLKRNKPK